jgi:tetraacyldisaccharide 4'-kinase
MIRPFAYLVPLYAGAVGAKNAAYERGWVKPQRLGWPVVSVGNLAVGGAGKTPLVIRLAQLLKAEGARVDVLSRGYGRRDTERVERVDTAGDAARFGDEPLLIARAAGVPVYVGASRYEAGLLAEREGKGTGVHLLDDGFQHRRLARDFDLVLIDATEPFGFGHVLPRGMLREPLRGLRRASAFLVTRVDQIDDATRASIVDMLRRHNPNAPIYASIHAASVFRSDDHPELIALDALRDRRWFAFCGIGGPSGFVRQLESLGGTNVGRRFFADHHDYTASDLALLAAEAKHASADVLVTTEKDWVKLAALRAPGGLPIWHLDIEIRFPKKEDERALLQQIVAALSRARG